MDGSRFDALTRRAFAIATSSVFASVLGIAAPVGTAAKKKNKNKKKRCRKLGVACTPGAKRKCCGDLRCNRVGSGGPPTFCCKTEGQSCRFSFDCCVPSFCNPTTLRCDLV